MSKQSLISSVLSFKNVNNVERNQYEIMRDWLSWYRGNVSDFHNYTIRVADTVQNCEMKSMQMAKKVCEDWTDLLWSEKVEINISDEKIDEAVKQVLTDNSFRVLFSDSIEKAFALGTGALVEFDNGESTTIEAIDGTEVIPIRNQGGRITAIITIDQMQFGVKNSTSNQVKFLNTVTTHEAFANGYAVIYEFYISSTNYELGQRVEDAAFIASIRGDAEPEEIQTLMEGRFTEGSPPYFQVIKPNISNNLFLKSPLGISIYANSIDTLKAIDQKYDSFTNEFVLGRRRIVVSADAMKVKYETDPNTQQVSKLRYFDKTETVYQVLPMNAEDMKDPVKQIDFELRAQEHIDAINMELNILALKVGLGAGYYTFDTQGLKTATEVVSEQSDLFRTKRKHEININKVLIDLVNAIVDIEVEAGRLSFKEFETSIKFDDSIVDDTTAQIDNGIKQVSGGVMSKETYLIEVKGLTEEQAREELAKIKAESAIASEDDLFGFGTKPNQGGEDE